VTAVARRKHLGAATRDLMWPVYETAFLELSALAANQHLMTYEQFTDVTADGRIVKYDAIDEPGGFAGLGVQTTHLDAWPLIAPRFFQRRWPVHYQQQRIFYVGFVCTRQDGDRPDPDTFAAILRAMVDDIRAVDGIAFMDFCTANMIRRLPERVQLILSRFTPDVRGGVVDAQTFYGFRFDGKDIDD
jgi:hypothetical protein